ncbi:glycosyltransferase family 2 protein [bacterium]|nr:MAG: glycosyltransferase family 2 protein [bacterium]
MKVRRHVEDALLTLQSKNAANFIEKIKKYKAALIRDYVQAMIIKRSLKMCLPQTVHLENKFRVLAISCYMANRPNLIEGIVKSVEEAKSTIVDFVVTNNTTVPSCPAVEPYVKYVMPRMAKGTAVKKIIEEQFRPHHDYIIVIDDDVVLPPNFFDKFFVIVKALGLVLSGAAVDKDSSIGYASNMQVDGAIVHLTQLVVFGPVTCFEKRIVSSLPFECDSPMGWGLSWVWARICRDKRYPIGIIDSLPVQHKLRKAGGYYDTAREWNLMKAYLSRTAHVPFCAGGVIGQTILKKDHPELNF